MTPGRYRVVDHTADMAFEVEGASFAELLATGVQALGDLMRAADEEPVNEAGLESRDVEVSGADLEDVLVAWLTEVLLAFEDDGFVARDARFERADASGAKGVLVGRRLDVEHEAPDRVVKAVTYHDLHVVEGDGDRPFTATVVLDL